MADLQELARYYKVFVPSDNVFQRRARLLQAMWRTEQNFPIGQHHEKPLGSRLAMPWAEETLSNYLTETIRQVVKAEVVDKTRSKSKLYGRPRIFNDLLSSQSLCFNLFGELQQDLALATAVFHTLTNGRVQRVTAIEFEYSPGRGDLKYSGDRSAFDVYVEFLSDRKARGYIGIEVKYHENLKDKPATLRPRYHEIAALMGCYKQECIERLQLQPLQQIWRDHLLAGSVQYADGFDDGFFVFLYPNENMNCKEAVLAYRSCLSDDSTFVDWTLEGVCKVIGQHTKNKWIERFVDRYLNFAKLAST